MIQFAVYLVTLVKLPWWKITKKRSKHVGN